MAVSALAFFKEYIDLLFINLKVKIGDFFEYLKVVSHYYSNPSFMKIDSYLIFSYLFNNPFGISKRFLIDKGEQDVHTYGETPLTTLEQIAHECRLSIRDTVFELGCGRGRSCFWLNQFIGCSVVGIDHIPGFISRANKVKKRFNITGVEFRLEDLLGSDLTGATVIYLYGTCLTDLCIQTLIEHFSRLPRGTKVITVSYSLSHYTSRSGFEVMKRFPAKFTWGIADVYLQIKK